jgi:hypothetical protein
LSGACSLARTFSPKFGIFFSSTCDIPKRRGKRISDDGNQKQKTALEKPRTSQSRHTKLSAKSKARAKASAKRAGRPYPNLVDNMNAAQKQRRRKRSRSKT